jgi:hypothetical protein
MIVREWNQTELIRHVAVRVAKLYELNRSLPQPPTFHPFSAPLP